MKRKILIITSLLLTYLSIISAQTNPLWTQTKIKNYLPDMTVPEVEDLLKKTDMVIIPIGALEQHGKRLPIGTDFINGVESCKLTAQEREMFWWRQF